MLHHFNFFARMKRFITLLLYIFAIINGLLLHGFLNLPLLHYHKTLTKKIIKQGSDEAMIYIGNCKQILKFWYNFRSKVRLYRLCFNICVVIIGGRPTR